MKYDFPILKSVFKGERARRTKRTIFRRLEIPQDTRLVLSRESHVVRASFSQNGMSQ